MIAIFRLLSFSVLFFYFSREAFSFRIVFDFPESEPDSSLRHFATVDAPIDENCCICCDKKSENNRIFIFHPERFTKEMPIESLCGSLHIIHRDCAKDLFMHNVVKEIFFLNCPLCLEPSFKTTDLSANMHASIWANSEVNLFYVNCFHANLKNPLLLSLARKYFLSLNFWMKFLMRNANIWLISQNRQEIVFLLQVLLKITKKRKQILSIIFTAFNLSIIDLLFDALDNIDDFDELPPDAAAQNVSNSKNHILMIFFRHFAQEKNHRSIIVQYWSIGRRSMRHFYTLTFDLSPIESAIAVSFFALVLKAPSKDGFLSFFGNRFDFYAHLDALRRAEFPSLVLEVFYCYLKGKAVDLSYWKTPADIKPFFPNSVHIFDAVKVRISVTHPKDLALILHCLATNSAIQHIELYFYRIEMNEMQEAATAMNTLKNINYLSIHGDFIPKNSLEILFSQLCLPCLNELLVESAELTEADVSKIGQFLQQTPLFNAIRLVDCALESKAFVKFCEMIAKITQIKTLEFSEIKIIYYFETNQVLRPDLTVLLAENILDIWNMLFPNLVQLKNLQNLLIDYADISDISVGLLTQTIRQCKGLMRIRLVGNLLTNRSASALAAVFAELPLLKEVRLDHNKFDFNAVPLFLEYLPKMTQLESICYITDLMFVEQIPQIIEALFFLPNIQTLTFKAFHIEKAPLRRLFEAVSRMPKLKNLHLDNKCLGFEELILLKKALDHCLLLKELSLEKNSLNSEAVTHLGAIVAAHPNMERLNITANLFTPEDLKQLVEFFPAKNNIDFVVGFSDIKCQSSELAEFFDFFKNKVGKLTIGNFMLEVN